ncbi:MULTISPECIES: hypothetical protein [unclassified Acinetobacter]|uniref:hypothetical protein n=1 Tax=unclassified Acinetobacter TaxID=196816 RepID=UPI0015D3B524|nr:MULTISPECIES: hypothetical protein [unclassified Acinetobacter]
MKVYMRHVRAAGYCRKEGVKPFFDARNWDWLDFIKNGIDAEKLIETNDAMALKVVEIAQEEYNEQREKTDLRT